MLFIKTEFPWVPIIETAHVLLAHYWELFELLDGLPIFVYSEQGSESWNKYIQNFKSGAGCHARQMSIEVNTKDVFTRMFYRSAPAIAFQKRRLECSKCGEFGHTARSHLCCKSAISAAVLSEEESMIQSCFDSRVKYN